MSNNQVGAGKKKVFKKNIFISDIKSEDMIHKEIKELFFIRRVEKKVNGSTTLELTLVDRTGELDGKIWYENIRDSYMKAENSAAVVTGSVGFFNNKYELKISLMEPLEEKYTYLPRDLCKSLENIEEMYERFIETYSKDIKKPHLKELLDKFYMNENEAFVRRLQDLQGGIVVHHSIMGGYIQHNTAVYDNCKVIGSGYANNADLHGNFDMDILLTAAGLHDIGKVREFKLFPYNQRTDEGILLGHLFMGITMISKAISEIKDFPKQDELKLLHCIATSHGQYKVVDPGVKPSTIEALILNRVDELDARFDAFNNLIKDDTEQGSMTKFNPIFEQYIYKR